MTHNEELGQYFQVGIVSGGVSHCGNTDIPDYYVRLDHPQVAEFIKDPENYQHQEAFEISTSAPPRSIIQGKNVLSTHFLLALVETRGRYIFKPPVVPTVETN
jgi:hypothetical protein